ncbi:MAG TPA: MBOAT family O-acyltransferase [Bacteroidales bacterium]|nr:MBOAT family O-acyltransferase [Bacteroidales bacterium]
MLFNSIEFLVFFIVVTTAYFVLPHKYRWFLLLASSCYFYMAFIPVYILILGFTIFIDYYAGIFIENSKNKRRKWFLITSLVANIGVLAVFKYYNFFNYDLTILLYGIGYENPIPYLSILLPIGLSFHTFQAMSYTIEVYRGNQKAERNFGIYALYVMFYPQLVAGPIERPQNLLHQFYEKHTFEYKRITDGLKLMVWGLFKKVVIADRLAVVVDQVYTIPGDYSGISLIIATFFFSFQIYCDFSGYSDIAIGAAQVMGFKLMKNFDRPYQSASIQEFWKRWHISLSTWFRDYLYISIGGNRVTIPRWYLNLFIVFVISGLWHGANWTFMIWGAVHGFYLIFALVTKNLRSNINRFVGLDKFPKVHRFFQTILVFILVSFAWIFFRANSAHDALYIIKSSITGLNEDFYKIANNIPLNLNLGLSNSQLILAFLLIVFMEFIQYKQKYLSIPQWLSAKPALIRWSVYYAVVLIILVLGVYEERQFIYFQF